MAQKRLRIDTPATTLRRDGIVVIPILSALELARVNSDFFNETPLEFKEGAQQLVLGGFAAQGHPSSFHSELTRRVRALVKSRSVPLFAEYANGTTKHALLFDRWCRREAAFGQPKKESWHRDVCDTLHNEEDEILGGWLNCNLEADQMFYGLKGTQGGDGRGFDPIRDPVQIAQYEHMLEVQGGPIVVPPGHMIVFVQSLVHRVAGGKQRPEPSIRLFLGHHLTNSTEPLFPIDLVIESSGVPRLPSGQLPAVFSSNHFGLDTKYKHLTNWAKNFIPRLVDPQNKYGLPRYNRGTRSLLSLREYGFTDEELAPFQYSRADVEVLIPSDF